MKVHTLETELWLARRRDEVFPFFAEAMNLEAITPAWLKFQVLTPGPIVLRRGLRIDYRLKVRGFPLRWQSEITAWEPPERFVDEQLRGPYRLWQHEHRFEEREGGTLCLDRVRYAAPGGAWVHRWFVRPDLERIFRYRQQRLQELLTTRS